MFDETGDERASQGWTPLVLDTNGNGVRDAYVGPNEPIDPTKDKRLSRRLTGSPQPPTGRSGYRRNDFPGALVRFTPGPNPAETALAEYFEPPWNHPSVPIQG